jgi:hypothetical protein
MRGPYFSRFLETVLEKHMSEVNPNSAIEV